MSYIVGVKVLKDGFIVACSCGGETGIETVNAAHDPTPLEFSVACIRCNTEYDFTIVPVAPCDFYMASIQKYGLQSLTDPFGPPCDKCGRSRSEHNKEAS